MTATPNRRWFRYSLRTLFVVVTVFGWWLGWQVNIVHNRKALLASLERHASESFDPHRAIVVNDNTGAILEISGMTWTKNPIPWFRRMLGDEPVRTLAVPKDMTADKVRRLRQAFPAAVVSGHFSSKGR